MKKILVKKNEEIEGKKLKGHSRKKLFDRGNQKYQGVVTNKFVAKENCYSEIEEILGYKDKQLSETSKKTIEYTIKCDTLSLFSLTKKYTSTVEHKSATHKANCWQFKKQTLAQVTLPRQDTINSIQKKLKAEKAKKFKKGKRKNR